MKMKKITMEEIINIVGMVLNWIPAVILVLFMGGYMENDRIVNIVKDNMLVTYMGAYCILMTIYQIVNYFSHRKN